MTSPTPEPPPSTVADPIRVLVVDDEESMRHFLERALHRRGFEVQTAASAAQALEVLAATSPDVLLTDIRMPGMGGHELLDRANEIAPGTRTVLMTAYGSIKDAIGALGRGAESYLTKPFETDELVSVLQKAAERARLTAENRILRELLATQGTFAGLAGTSKAMRRLYRTIEQVARTDGTALVIGESGTGKELVARAIHQRSARRDEPFVAVHAGALPKGLVEAELFGVAEGAFTGADRSRSGYVERAGRGTLFLDEISELPLEAQPSLLRFVEGHELSPVGGTRSYRSEARLVVATNRDLRELVEEGSFRPDLFYRLNVLPVRVPPLRDRPEDIPLLVVKALADFGRPELVFPPHVMAALQGWDYPGNVRELRNIVERLASTVDAETVELEHLPPELRGEGGQPETFRTYRLALEGFERKYLEGLLQRTGGNISEAARIGGLSRPSLHARIAALGIDLEAIRRSKS